MNLEEWEYVEDPDALLDPSWEFLSYSARDDPAFEHDKDKDGCRGGWVPATHESLVNDVGRPIGSGSVIYGWVRRRRNSGRLERTTPVAAPAPLDEGTRLVQYFCRTTPVEVVVSHWPSYDID